LVASIEKVKETPDLTIAHLSELSRYL
jgi:uncharacterized protein YlzI (FlbEa/FlbD family)